MQNDSRLYGNYHTRSVFFFNRMDFLEVRFMKTILIILIAFYFTACSSGGSGGSNQQARALVSVNTFQACSALAQWDKSLSDLQISPTVGSYGGFTFSSDGLTPYITLRSDGKAYLEPQYAVGGILDLFITNAQFNMNDCTLTMDGQGNLTVTAAVAPNDQI